MERIATLLRHMQLYAHIAHNLTSGNTFFQDHEFLGELYPAYEAAYDSVVERMIGCELSPDLIKINKNAANMLERVSFKEINSALSILLDCERTLCNLIEKEVVPNPTSHPHGGEKALSQGSVQMLGDIANASEVRKYKIQQRLKS